jgi:hypothetical protein
LQHETEATFSSYDVQPPLPQSRVWLGSNGGREEQQGRLQC